MLRYLSCSTAIFLLLFCLAIVGIRLYDGLAQSAAKKIGDGLRGKNQEQTIENVARWAASNFDPNGATWHARYTYLLENEKLPAALRLKRGSTAIFELKGSCDTLARVLELVYGQLGIEARQHDINSPRIGHVALSIKNGDHWVFIDPYNGALFKKAGRLLGLDEIRDALNNGASLEEISVPMKQSPDLRVYQGGDFIHALKGEAMRFGIMLDTLPFALGTKDGSKDDVISAALKHGLTPHLDYMGPRYSRSWTFEWKLAPSVAPTGYTVAFALIDAPDKDNLPESNIQPKIEGQSVIYDVPKGSSLLLKPGTMQWTLGMILRRQSWYDVDAVAVRPASE